MKWRAIARALHISRNTVRQIVTEHTMPRASSRTLHSASARAARAALEARRLPLPDRELLATYPDITAQRVFEILSREGLRRRLHAGQGTGAQYSPEEGDQAEPRNAAARAGDMAECDWSPYEVPFTHAPRRDAAGLRLHAALLDAKVLRLPGGQWAASPDGRATSTPSSASRGAAHRCKLRQPEAGGAALGGKPADLQLCASSISPPITNSGSGGPRMRPTGSLGSSGVSGN